MTSNAPSSTPRSRLVAGAVLGAGIGAGLVALVVTIVYVFQPWRTCPYDDSPAACAMLPGDAAVMMTAMAAMPVAAIVTVVGAVLLRRARSTLRA